MYTWPSVKEPHNAEKLDVCMALQAGCGIMHAICAESGG